MTYRQPATPAKPRPPANRVEWPDSSAPTRRTLDALQTVYTATLYAELATPTWRWIRRRRYRSAWQTYLELMIAGSAAQARESWKDSTR